jgi:hypothetical protein
MRQFRPYVCSLLIVASFSYDNEPEIGTKSFGGFFYFFNFFHY